MNPSLHSLSLSRFFPSKGWLAAAAAAVLATAVSGWWLGHQDSGSVTASAGSRETRTPSPRPKPPAPSKTPPAVGQWIAEIEKERLPSARSAAAARLAVRLTPEEWPELLRNLTWFESDIIRTVLEAAVIRRWAAANPAEAAEWGLRNHPGLAAAAGAEWVRRDPAAAVAWFNGFTPEQRWNAGIQYEFYSALLRRDATACLELILRHQSDPEFRLGGLEWKIAALSPERALEFAARLTEEDERSSLLRAVATEMGKRDAFSAIDWAGRQPEAEKMLTAVFQQVKMQPAGMIPAFASLTAEQQNLVHDGSWVWWERGDPFTTLDALRRAPEGLTDDSRQKLFARAMSTLAPRYDPRESARRLETQFPEFAGKWERWLADEWSKRDPEETRQWIESLAPGEARDKALNAYEKNWREWSRPKPDPAANITGMLARQSDRSLKFDSLLRPLTQDQRQAVWGQVSALPGDQRLTAQTRLISFQAGEDPAVAASWLTSQSDALPPNPELTSRLAANWALDDASAAADWVDSLPEGEARKWALWNLSRQWRRVDTAAARRWAASRPPSDRAVMESGFAGRPP